MVDLMVQCTRPSAMVHQVSTIPQLNGFDYTTVLPTKSDIDVMFCLQSYNRQITCELMLSAG